jgi:hypothetical protein
LFFPPRRTYATGPDAHGSTSAPINVWNADARSGTWGDIAMVDSPMSEPNNSLLDDNASRIQIEKDTWLELTRLCERIVDSFGLIGPMLELAKDKSDGEQLKSLVAIRNISTEGYAALKEFALLWARLDEQAHRDGIRFCPEDL